MGGDIGVAEPGGDRRGDHQDRAQRERTDQQGRTRLGAGPYPGGVGAQRGAVPPGSAYDDDEIGGGHARTGR